MDFRSGQIQSPLIYAICGNKKYQWVLLKNGCIYKVIPHLAYYLCADLSCAAKVDGENDSSFF